MELWYFRLLCSGAAGRIRVHCSGSSKYAVVIEFVVFVSAPFAVPDSLALTPTKEFVNLEVRASCRANIPANVIIQIALNSCWICKHGIELQDRFCHFYSSILTVRSLLFVHFESCFDFHFVVFCRSDDVLYFLFFWLKVTCAGYTYYKSYK